MQLNIFASDTVLGVGTLLNHLLLGGVGKGNPTDPVRRAKLIVLGQLEADR